MSMADYAGTEAVGAPDGATDVKSRYLDALKLIERLHRCLLDVIKDEFDRAGENEINSVQALLLFNIGEAELTAGELRTRGHYLGSNVSYNLKKLVEAGYIHHERAEHDRRSVRVRLTEKGQQVSRRIDDLYNRHIKSLGEVGDVSSDDLADVSQTLMRLERFWTDQIRYRL